MSKRDVRLANEGPFVKIDSDNVATQQQMIDVVKKTKATTAAKNDQLATELSKLQSTLGDILAVQTKILDQGNPELDSLADLVKDMVSVQANVLDYVQAQNREDLNEVSNLIRIRDYVLNTSNNAYASRASVNAAAKMLPFIDAKILSVLMGEDFSDYIGSNKS